MFCCSLAMLRMLLFGRSASYVGAYRVAKIKLKSEEDLEYFRKRLYKFCIDKLERYKILRRSRLFMMISLVRKDLRKLEEKKFVK